MIDANVEPTSDESDFASQNHGLLRRGDTWYRLNGWGTADNWSACPLVRVPDDHAAAILNDPFLSPDSPFRRVKAEVQAAIENTRNGYDALTDAAIDAAIEALNKGRP